MFKHGVLDIYLRYLAVLVVVVCFYVSKKKESVHRPAGFLEPILC